MGAYVKLEDVFETLHRLGGCDAVDEWAQGYDAAIDAAIMACEELKTHDAIFTMARRDASLVESKSRKAGRYAPSA